MRLPDIKSTQSMTDTDKFIVIVNGSEHLITKENLQKIFSGLTSNQRDKLSKIVLTGDGTKLLNDKGSYTAVIDLLSNIQFKKNNAGKIELVGYHTHNNNNVLSKLEVNENGVLLFNGEAISSYILPSATNTTLGGVKVDGDTIKINNGVISADVIGNWASGVHYPVGYFVVHNNTLYQCIKSNSDIEWIKSNWQPITSDSGDTTNITEWEINTHYTINDLIIYESTLYKCSEEHTSTTEFDSKKWTSLTGEKGDKGDVGNNGKNGSDGKSAYQIAVENGFIGSENDWLQSLNGEDGITPYISSETKHWMIGDIDTGIIAEARITSETGENFVTKTEFDELNRLVSTANTSLENVLNGGV